MKPGDIIQNKMKEGPKVLITEMNDSIAKGLILEGDEDGKRVTFSREDMWVFEKVEEVRNKSRR